MRGFVIFPPNVFRTLRWPVFRIAFESYRGFLSYIKMKHSELFYDSIPKQEYSRIIIERLFSWQVTARVLAGDELTVVGIGLRRRILLVEGCRSPELVKPWRHARIVEGFCARHGLKLELFNYKSLPPPISVPQTSNSPFASPLLGPRSPGLHSSEPGLQSFKPNDGMPPLSLGPSFMKGSHSPPWSPPLGPRHLAPPVMALQEKLHGSPQVGVVHLALHSDVTGMILR